MPIERVDYPNEEAYQNARDREMAIEQAEEYQDCLDPSSPYYEDEEEED